MGIFSTIFGNKKNGSLKTVIKEGAFLVDVRSEIEFSSGSVNGAVNIPLEKMQAQITRFKNKKNIVLFCRSGSRSSMAKTMLEQSGFKNVVNGGSWQKVKQEINE